MYVEHGSFEEPRNDNNKLWRYFDLPKLLSLIVSETLYFTSVTTLNQADPLEGLWPLYDFLSIVEGSTVEAWREWHSSTTPQWNSFTFVNCWHLNETESIAMWRLYGGQFAIQTTFGRLKDAFPEDRIHAGKVKYVNYANQLIHSPGRPSEYATYMTKDSSFDHEKEFRVILPDYPPRESVALPYEELKALYSYLGKGISVKVSIPALVENIYISPTVEPWQVSLLETLLQPYKDKFGWAELPIRKSTIGVIPEALPTTAQRRRHQLSRQRRP